MDDSQERPLLDLFFRVDSALSADDMLSSLLVLPDSSDGDDGSAVADVFRPRPGRTAFRFCSRLASTPALPADRHARLRASRSQSAYLRSAASLQLCP